MNCPLKSPMLNAIYHFTFTGAESRRATVIIQDQTLQVQDGHTDKASISVTADMKTWLGLLAKEQNVVWAILRRKVRVRGSLKLPLAFGKCFPA